MMALLILALLSQPLQAPFTRFTYCRDFPRGLYEKQCLVLTPDGAGQGQFKRRGSDQVQTVITLSASGRARLLSVIAATNNLQDAKNYETKRKVADLGRKHLTLEVPSGTREADFNYSDLKEVNALATFFDGLLNQQTIGQDLETASRYERLSVPQRLEQLESELKSGRIGDPEGLVPLLDKIIQNDQILKYAREMAQQIKVRALTPIKEK
jgi:hypothetical protein